MKYTSDHDGKSKTASAVDQIHYPEQDEVENQESAAELPTHDQIAERARELWRARGEDSEGSAEQDWFQAEAELKETRRRPKV